MTLPRTAAIVGLGLMGGSLARDLAQRGVQVLGYDPDPGALQGARQAGVLHLALSPTLEEAAAADLLVLAVPVSAAREVLSRALPSLAAGAVITDLGSTKRTIVRVAEELGIGERFVGSHPLAGDHRSGWAASRQGLFAGTRVFVCPTATTGDEAMARVRDLWSSLGALPEAVEAGEHDRRLAWTSHLPQIASTALAVALDGAGHPQRELGPGGRDATRLAASSPEMWSAICADNADELQAAVASLEAQLAALRGALRDGDEARVRGFFSHGRRWSAGEPTAR